MQTLLWRPMRLLDDEILSCEERLKLMLHSLVRFMKVERKDLRNNMMLRRSFFMLES